MRTFIAIFSFVLVLIIGGMCYQYSVKSDHARESLNFERYERISAEEEAHKAWGQVKILEGKNDRLIKKAESLEKALDQKTTVIKSLKVQMNEFKAKNSKLAAKIKKLTKQMAKRMAPSTQGL